MSFSTSRCTWVVVQTRGVCPDLGILTTFYNEGFSIYRLNISVWSCAVFIVQDVKWEISSKPSTFLCCFKQKENLYSSNFWWLTYKRSRSDKTSLQNCLKKSSLQMELSHFFLYFLISQYVSQEEKILQCQFLWISFSPGM